MNKADLLNSDRLEVTKEIIDIAKSDVAVKETSYGRTSNIYKYYWFYRAKIIEIKGKQILKVCLFRRKEVIRGLKTPAYEIYISKEENKYLTYDLDEKKWRTAKIDNLIWGEDTNYHAVGRHYCKGVSKIIVGYLDNDKKTPYESIFNFQTNVLADNLHREHKKITDRIDAAMELVPELPKDFKAWTEETAMINSRYIYYFYSKNVKEGYCTHCKQMVPVDHPKNNVVGTCKQCKSKIVFKSIVKSATVFDEGYASIFQKTKEGFILRYFVLRKTYKNYQAPEYRVRETVRILYDNRFIEKGSYEYAEFKTTGIIRWCLWEEKSYSYSSYTSNNTYVNPSTLYDKNLKKVFEGSEFQYSAIELFAKGLKGERFYPGEYLAKYRNHKYLEYMVKLKLFKITKACIKNNRGNEFYEYGNRIHDVLKVRKEQIKVLSEMNASADELRIMQKANTAGVKLSKEQIRWIAENLGRSELIGYMKYSTPHKTIRYLKEKSKKAKISNISNDYYDYLEYSEKLGYDLQNEFILFPKHLKEAHDIASEEWKAKQKTIDKMLPDERNKVMESIAEELVKKLAMKDKHFTVRIPWTCDEIKKEGHTLHHCVGNYVDRVLKKETAILLIRKIEDVDTPFYTMEVKRGEVIQVRGKSNADPTPEVQAFVDKFKAKKLLYQPEREAV